jgi:hypothetical protein
MDELAALLEDAAAHPETPTAKRLIAAVFSLPVPMGVSSSPSLRAFITAKRTIVGNTVTIHDEP